MPAGWCPRVPRKLDNTLSCGNRLPRWNPSIESLCLKFIGGRVLRSSKKNFLMCNAPQRQHRAEEQGEPCCQFGKVRSGRFNLDFRYPFSPVQAFAMALSTFCWLGK